MLTKYKILDSHNNTKILGEHDGKLQIKVNCRYCSNSIILNVPIDEYIDFSERSRPSLPSLTDDERLFLWEEWCGFCATDYEKQNPEIFSGISCNI